MSLANIAGTAAGVVVVFGGMAVIVWAPKLADYMNETNSQLPRWRTYPMKRTAEGLRVLAILGLALGALMLALGLSGSFA